MLSKILSAFGLKQSATTRAVTSVFTGLNRAVWTPRDFAHLTSEGYSKNVYVFRCVEYVSTAFAGVPWCLYSKEGVYKRRLKEIRKHPLLSLWERPNPQESGTDWRARVAAFRLLNGNSYIERVGPNSGPPKELYSHRPDRMEVVSGNAVNPIAGYVYTANGVPTPFRAEQILHWKAFHPLNDWYGMSPLEATSYSLDQNNESRAWNVSLLQNACRPPGAFVAEDGLTDDQFQRLQELVESRYSGSMNAGRPLLLEGGAKWEKFGYDAVEMAWIEGLKLSTREICTGFGVPPELLGDSANKTYSNYGEARKAFYEETILPLLDSFRDAINAWLMPLFGEGLYLSYDKDEIEALREDQDKVHARVREDVRGGILTPNEAREAIGYDKYTSEEADKLYISTQLIPLEAISSWEVTAPGEQKPQGEQTDEAKKAAAWDRIQKADWLSPKQKCELTGFDYDPTLEPKPEPPPPPPPAPVINVTTPPVTISLTMPNGAGKKTVIRDEHGQISEIVDQIQ